MCRHRRGLCKHVPPGVVVRAWWCLLSVPPSTAQTDRWASLPPRLPISPCSQAADGNMAALTASWRTHSITRILTGARPPPVRTLTCTTVHNFLRAQHKVLFALAVLSASADDKHDTRPVDLKACSKTWCCLASDQQSLLSPTSFMTPGRGKRGGVLSPCHSPSTPPFPCWLCASYTINNP